MTREGIGPKLDRFRANLEELDRLPRATREEFLSDTRNLWSAIYLLQVSIQVLIDVASYVSASLGLPVPTKSRGLLESLEAAGHLPHGSAKRFGPIFAFRNRVVHLYERVDPDIVYRIVRENRGDLEDLMSLLMGLLDRADEGR